MQRSQNDVFLRPQDLQFTGHASHIFVAVLTPKVSEHLSHIPAPFSSQYSQLGVAQAPQAVPVVIGPVLILHLSHFWPIVVHLRQSVPQSIHLVGVPDRPCPSKHPEHVVFNGGVQFLQLNPSGPHAWASIETANSTTTSTRLQSLAIVEDEGAYVIVALFLCSRRLIVLENSVIRRKHGKN
jgi:hypothetical protein